jgi:2-keto-4-pentenoate hydratase/2-oxohepta-3-ene-1,7-dioic acid hydratase in catechol pathway
VRRIENRGGHRAKRASPTWSGSFARVVAGQSGDALLDSYGEKRRALVIKLTSRIKDIGHVICERDPQAAKARDTRVLVVRQATIDQMIFDIPRQLEYCSTFSRLEPGDVIATGAPGGVGAKRNPPLWLKPGDKVEVELDRLGIFENGIADEA